MAELIDEPATFPAPGGKVIAEYVGRLRTGTEAVSVARMTAPPGWHEPAQTPEFDEVTLVISGQVLVETGDGVIEVGPGQAVLTPAGERVRYRVGPDGADYVAVCVPAFGIELVNRED
jgi:quercetin dioxygenase-like cupin family protein